MPGSTCDLQVQSWFNITARYHWRNSIRG